MNNFSLKKKEVPLKNIAYWLRELSHYSWEDDQWF